ncbi:MAG: hypothetical protein HRU20_04235 [Pseudomonadales bacterium]|nr:hypothetical protein [Pseudomonadales bacterium]
MMSNWFKALIFIPLISLIGCGDESKIATDSFIYKYLAEDDNAILLTDFIDVDGQSTTRSRTMAECAFYQDTPCALNTLDFLGNSTATPSKEQIMQRLIVSHPWMAETFSAALDDMPEDMYHLFASTTTIVIHANIRPAFFWSDTGAIYLDPQYLWQTQSQLNTISKEEDYRAGFGSALNYMTLARYSLNGKRAWSYESRSSTDVLYALSALLFHELAHARDFFSISSIQNADKKLSPLALSNISIASSENVDATYPLNSQTLHELANVQFRGVAATQNLIDLFAEDVAALFAPDGANDDYAYLESLDTLHYEDTAMLFEEVMMKRHYNIDREFAFANLLSSPIIDCGDLSIQWSVINRFMDDSVIPRAQFIVNALLPNNNHGEFFNNLPAKGRYTYCLPATNARSKGTSPEKIQPGYDWH